MTTRALVMLSAAIEAVTGVALIATPNLVAGLLLGADLARGGIAIAGVAGFGLFSLAVACWSSSDTVTAQPLRALFIYNLLAAFYLAYLRVGGGFAGYLLWPACAVHALFAILFARLLIQGAKRSSVTVSRRIL